MTEVVVAAETSISSRLDPGSFNDPTSTTLDHFMKGGWGPQPPFVSPPSPTPTLLARRRARLSTALPDSTLVVCSGNPVSRNGDQFYRFRTSSEYAWLTGDQSPNGVLVMSPTNEPQLFLQPPSERDNGEFWKDFFTGELWVGRRPSLDQRSQELGIECRPLSELAVTLRACGHARFLPDVDAPVASLIEEYDAVDNRELRAVVSELRLVKDAWEIQQLRDAVDATIRGFGDVARLLQSDTPLSERQIEVTFGARARLDGYETGYPTIAAFGEHAATLHW
ncbi:MAG: aminopeptidase P family protein, partial [Acidobacteria bacterium]|nr:aminopeptidase P family protein [Acidobacteriota bacterium]